MDAHTRAVPDLVLTMSQAIRYAEKGFSFSKLEPTYHLPTTLCNLFRMHTNATSGFLRTFYCLLPEMALVVTHAKCTDPVAFFLEHGSFKSAHDRIKKEASKRHRDSLETIASPELKALLNELLIASSSYPIIGMSRTILSHRQPNDLFLINLKMKLHLELYHPSNCPTCICVIDPHGMHTFCCVRVSKRGMHDRVWDDTAPVICTLLKMAGIIGKSSRVDTELKNAVRGIPGLCPLDSYFRPVPSLKQTTVPPIPYTYCGYDFTMTYSKGHVPPSQRSCANKKRDAWRGAPWHQCPIS